MCTPVSFVTTGLLLRQIYVGTRASIWTRGLIGVHIARILSWSSRRCVDTSSTLPTTQGYHSTCALGARLHLAIPPSPHLSQALIPLLLPLPPSSLIRPSRRKDLPIPVSAVSTPPPWPGNMWCRRTPISSLILRLSRGWGEKLVKHWLR